MTVDMADTRTVSISEDETNRDTIPWNTPVVSNVSGDNRRFRADRIFINYTRKHPAAWQVGYVTLSGKRIKADRTLSDKQRAQRIWSVGAKVRRDPPEWLLNLALQYHPDTVEQF